MRKAVSIGVPVLGFIIDDSAPWPNDRRDTGPNRADKMAKLGNFGWRNRRPLQYLRWFRALRPEILMVVGVEGTVSRAALVSVGQHLSTTRVSRNKDPRQNRTGVFAFHPLFLDETYMNDDTWMKEAVEGGSWG